MTDTAKTRRHAEGKGRSGRSAPARLRLKKQNGNAMIYVLIALALFGFLTMMLSRQGNQADGQDLDDEQAKLYALELIEYAASTQQIVDMMLYSGSEISDLDFVNPSSATDFSTAPHIHKVFHPKGGGLNYQEVFSEDIQNGASAAWVANKNINVDWTTSSANDVVFTAYFITQEICALINKQITGSTTIPVTASPHSDYFLSTGNEDLTTIECADCEGHSSLCVENDTNDNYSFYNIIAAQ